MRASCQFFRAWWLRFLSRIDAQERAADAWERAQGLEPDEAYWEFTEYANGPWED